MTTRAKTKILKFKVTIVIESDGDGFYAHSPALPGLLVDGESKDEALQNARDGATALLHSMVRDGDIIPLSIYGSDKTKYPTIKSNHKYHFQEEIKVTIE